MKAGQQKGAVVQDGFNRKKRQPRAKTTEEIQEKVDTIKAIHDAKQLKIAEEKSQKKLENEAKKESKSEADNEKSAMAMLQDLRYAYRNSKGADGKKGRQRLLDLMSNDADFKFAMKELMKIEASIASAKIRSKEAQQLSNTTTFVILKGLHDDVVGLKVKSDGVIDMAQVQDAINPSSEPRIEFKEEMARPEGG